MTMARAKASEQTAITSAARLRLAGCGCGENLGAFFSDWLSGAFFDAAADGVCFLVAGAAAQRWYTSRISSDPFGRAKYASSFAKSAIGWSPSDAIHFEVKSRSGAGIACPDVSTWSMRARRCTESTWPKAKSVRTSMPPSAVRRMSDASGASSSRRFATSAAHVASTIATASSQETETRRAITVSSVSGSEESIASNDVSNSGTGVLAANGPRANEPATDRPGATELRPCVEAADSASNCARGSSDPAA